MVTTRLGLYGGPRAPYPGFTPAAATATISGTAIDGGVLESAIVAGGETIVITLANDTWVSFDDTIRQAIIDGLDSGGTELTGWNNEVRDKEVVGSVSRDSNTVVTITLTASTAYSITANETITVTVPASALTGGVEITGSPTFDVTNETPAAVAGGPSAGASYPHVPHRWPREKRKRKKLYEKFEEAIEEAATADRDVKKAVVEALEPIIGPASFDVNGLENRIEAAIIDATTKEMAVIRRKLKKIEDIIDDHEVELLLLN